MAMRTSLFLLRTLTLALALTLTQTLTLIGCEVVMVDLDPALVEVTEKHLPYWDGVKADPRFKLIVGDAIAWMKDFIKNAQEVRVRVRVRVQG